MIKLTVKLGESEEQPTVTEWSQEDFTYGQFKYKGKNGRRNLQIRNYWFL